MLLKPIFAFSAVLRFVMLQVCPLYYSGPIILYCILGSVFLIDACWIAKAHSCKYCFQATMGVQQSFDEEISNSSVSETPDSFTAVNISSCKQNSTVDGLSQKNQTHGDESSTDAVRENFLCDMDGTEDSACSTSPQKMNYQVVSKLHVFLSWVLHAL